MNTIYPPVAEAWFTAVYNVSGGVGAHHKAWQVAGLAADVALVPVLARTDGRRGAMAAVGVVLTMLAKRLAGNAPAPAQHRVRTYLNRLVFDRDTVEKQQAGL